ncbi:hypothetical protein DNTS_026851 [Danionella cerebrum]|uniref:EGF-like domain-containing protein n=1 Tax=Danionella cerebrum TaxID=2873325 RepID=A0A553NI22_9TELE|nr:hypothetical protein DNTS_026851 [Danionella translucida]
MLTLRKRGVMAKTSAAFPTAVEAVNDGLMHTVEVLIQNQSLSLVVDKGAPKSMGKLPRPPAVDHSTQLYIGGFPSLQDTAGLRPGAFQPFSGCIHEVRLNGELQDLSGALAGPEGVLPGCHTCSVCVHGECVPQDSAYTCLCADGYSGQFCDRQEEPMACSRHHCVFGECRVTETGEPVCHCQPGYSGPTCETELTCEGETLREPLKRQMGHKSCMSSSKILRLECHHTCSSGLCCSATKSRRRKVSFKCSDGSSFSEEVDITVECGCTKCPS